MSSSQQCTIGLVVNHHPQDDEEDNNICPVCDGECTCNNIISRPPLSLNAHPPACHQSSTSSHPLAPLQPKPSLKIKLTVPQSMLTKRRANLQAETMSTAIEKDEGNDRDGSTSAASSTTPIDHQPVTPPKRRGRPPKSARNPVANHCAQARAPVLTQRKNVFITQKKRPPRLKLTKDKQAASAATAAIKRKVVVATKKRRRPDYTAAYDDEENESDQFPTFVSASALSSLSSFESDASTSSESEADSEIEVEEERFIIAEVRDKARARRELLGGGENQKKRDHYNNWIIRPRKRSVGPSDEDMDVDTEATGEDDEQDEDEDEDGDEDDDETDEIRPGRGYVGLATGWSDDEESSFDAELFFANLTDSDTNSTSSTSGDEDDDQADQSDIDSVSVDVTDLLPHLRRGLENLPFEVAESWDGQIVFTNGLHDGQGVLDIDFEIDAAQFMADPSISPASSGGDSDVQMAHSDVDDGGYEEDADGGEGDTTDEELVGEDDLPNERAMKLFNFPLSVSAINPMSTVSPGPFNRWSPGSKGISGSPKPADILAGKVFWDSDDPEDMDDGRQDPSPPKGLGPRTGCFVPNAGTRNAVIDGTHQDVPSPHPGFQRRTAKSAGRSSNLRKQSLMANIASSPLVDRSSPFISSDNGSIPPDTPSVKTIELNDVLEASFLDPDPPEMPGSNVASDCSAKGFPRWDLISVGAFRQTRETGSAVTEGVPGWRPDAVTDDVTNYGRMVKPRPLDAMLWQNRNHSGKPPRGRRAIARMMDISPVILPRDGDGDKTPINVHSSSYQQHQPQKSRKELRRERKLKKTTGPVHHQHQHHAHRHQNQHHHHHQHHHYPNMKSRSAASVQRTNFFGSSVPPLSL